MLFMKKNETSSSYLKGYNDGYKFGRQEGIGHKYTANEIREIFGLPLIEERQNFLDKTLNLPNDPVNHPSHYTQGGIECIDAIKASMTEAEFRGFLKGQVIKYIWRYELKGKPGEDLNKADFYLKRLRKEVGEG